MDDRVSWNHERALSVPSLFAIAILLAAAPANAATPDQQVQAQRVEILGTHKGPKHRHLLKIEDCQMQKFLWKTEDGEHEVLWSVLELNLVDLAPPDGPDPSIAIVPFPTLETETVIFTMRPGTLTRSEETLRQNPKPPHTPSPRDGGDAYVYRDKDGFSFSFTSIKPGHMANLADALFDYRQTYCVPAS